MLSITRAGAGLAREWQALHQGAVTVASRILPAFSPVLDLLYPPRCPLCGGGLAGQDGLCTPCWEELQIPGSAACAGCMRPLPGAGPATRCGPCLARPPAHDGIVAGTIYNDASRRLVLAFKHGRRISLARMLARLMAARLPALDEDWLVVPVPLHRWRLWQRGFNQAALLAREIARLRGATLLVDGLERRKATPMLGGLGRKDRRRTLSGALQVNRRRRGQIEGAKVLLVDDVLTSGATSDACTRILREAGARTVVISCFARVVDEA